MEDGNINTGNNHGPKKKTPAQLLLLEKFYSENKYPKQKELEDYAVSLNLSYKQARLWFVDRRKKERKETEIYATHAKMGNFALESMKNIGRKRIIRLQVLFPKDYILRKVFRKDGPPLGAEFDPPWRAFGHQRGALTIDSCCDGQKNAKKRKILESPAQQSSCLHDNHVPAKKHGAGKGLMTVWRATNSHRGDFPSGLDLLDGSAAWRPSRPNTNTETPCEDLKKGRPVSKEVTVQKKVEKKINSSRNKRKVLRSNIVEPKESPPFECNLSLDESQSSEHSNDLELLIDDEVLELEEMQAGSNPLRCSSHLTSSGRHGCPLCKDLLARFPPQTVKLKQTFLTRPWDSSSELVKKLFKVLRFLYTHSTSVEVYPFTFDEFAQAFHDKDSLLLGKVHVALLKLLLSHSEGGQTGDFVPRSSIDCRFHCFLNFVREQEFNVNFWSKSLNALTWIEILRQVLVAAGFGSKHTLHRDFISKEKNQMIKFGLCSRTLKGELFSILSKKGSGGLRVSELAKSSQIVELDLCNSAEDLEQLIYSTLSGDITLFEKISTCAYRLRVDPRIKGKEDAELDSEDSGSVDNDSVDASTSSSSDESDDNDELNSSWNENRIVKRKVRNKEVGQKLAKHCEIDESYSGEAWLLGLMEAEYSDLSIDEKLDALIALVDLVAVAASILRIEEPIRATSTTPNAPRHASGAKVKKSTRNHHLLSDMALDRQPLEKGMEAPAEGQLTSNKSGDSFGNSEKNCTEASSQAVHPSQSIYLGSDRRYNKYWLLLGPCTINDPGHRRIYAESSEDGHWAVIDTPQDVHALLSVLDRRGTREARLLASMEKRQAFLCQAMERYIQEDVGGMRQTSSSDLSHLETSSGDGTSPISNIDNTAVPTSSTGNLVMASCASVTEVGRRGEEKKQKWERLQAFDKWIWNCFYAVLDVVKCSKSSYMESLARCESCHDLFWRDEKHCRTCHSTFELDFNLEETYAIHKATCREAEDICDFPKHRVLSSQLQALKAAIHAIEATLPEMALASSWRKSMHRVWVKRLRRTSSLPELLQVLVDFVGALNEDWLYECASDMGSNSYLDDVTVYFQTMPQTTSAVALWVVKLDALISFHLERTKSAGTVTKPSLLNGKRPCT